MLAHGASSSCCVRERPTARDGSEFKDGNVVYMLGVQPQIQREDWDLTARNMLSRPPHAGPPAHGAQDDAATWPARAATSPARNGVAHAEDSHIAQNVEGARWPGAIRSRISHTEMFGSTSAVEAK